LRNKDVDSCKPLELGRQCEILLYFIQLFTYYHNPSLVLLVRIFVRLVRGFLRILHEFMSEFCMNLRVPIQKSTANRWFSALTANYVTITQVFILNLLYYMLMLPNTINLLRMRNCKEVDTFPQVFHL
jgi:hypothetical protein